MIPLPNVKDYVLPEAISSYPPFLQEVPSNYDNIIRRYLGAACWSHDLVELQGIATFVNPWGAGTESLSFDFTEKEDRWVLAALHFAIWLRINVPATQARSRYKTLENSDSKAILNNLTFTLNTVFKKNASPEEVSLLSKLKDFLSAPQNLSETIPALLELGPGGKTLAAITLNFGLEKLWQDSFSVHPQYPKSLKGSLIGLFQKASTLIPRDFHYPYHIFSCWYPIENNLLNKWYCTGYIPGGKNLDCFISSITLAEPAHQVSPLLFPKILETTLKGGKLYLETASRSFLLTPEYDLPSNLNLPSRPFQTPVGTKLKLLGLLAQGGKLALWGNLEGPTAGEPVGITPVKDSIPQVCEKAALSLKVLNQNYNDSTKELLRHRYSILNPGKAQSSQFPKPLDSTFWRPAVLLGWWTKKNGWKLYAAKPSDLLPIQLPPKGNFLFTVENLVLPPNFSGLNVASFSESTNDLKITLPLTFPSHRKWEFGIDDGYTLFGTYSKKTLILDLDFSYASQLTRRKNRQEKVAGVALLNGKLYALWQNSQKQNLGWERISCLADLKLSKTPSQSHDRLTLAADMVAIQNFEKLLRATLKAQIVL